jgi:hypothetical protein
MTPDLGVAIASLGFSVVTSVFAGYIALVSLKYSAKPRLRIDCDVDGRAFSAAQALTVHFAVSNIGHWYSKPSATHTRLYINFPLEVQLIECRFGSGLQRSDAEPKPGKGGHQYLLATGLRISFGELPEVVEVDVVLPGTVGRCKGWVAAFAAETDCGRWPFSLRVSPQPETPKAVLVDPSI